MIGAAIVSRLAAYLPELIIVGAVIGVLGGVYGAGYAHANRRAEARIVALEARIAQAQALAEQMARYADQQQQAWRNAAERLVNEKQARLDLIAADRSSLYARLREYEARRAREVPGATGGAGGNAGAVGDGGGLPAAAPDLDDFARRARRCDVLESFWIAYAQSVGVKAR